MSEMREQQQQTQTGAGRVPQQRAYREQTTGTSMWAGWVTFGAMMMILLGSFQAIAGLVALFDDGYYRVTANGLIVHANYATWGTVHLIVGLVALAAGIGLMTGAMWARVTGVVVAMISAVVNLGFLNAYPLWGLTMIALDVVIIYAITTHGGELKHSAY